MKNRPPRNDKPRSGGFGKKPDRSDRPRGERRDNGDAPKKRWSSDKPKRDGERKPWSDKSRGEKRDTRENRPARARHDEQRSDRPRRDGEKKPWADKPRGEKRDFRKDRPPRARNDEQRRDGEKKPWSDKPRGEKREFRKDRPPRDRNEQRSERPRREDGERKPWADKPHGEKREFSKDRPARTHRDEQRSERPRREDGDKKPWANKPRGEKREFRKDRSPRDRDEQRNERPQRDGDKKPWADKPRGEKREFRKDHHPAPQARATAYVSRAPENLNGPLRIAKRIAEAGICSRRDAERLIDEGRVTLNGERVSTPAITVTADDIIEVDGKRIAVRATETRLFLYNKPRGEIVSERDPQGRPTVFDNLPQDLPRLISVGRLDLDSEGLLLLTTSGGLARELELPATGHARTYRVRVMGRITEKHIHMLKVGITVEGVTYGSIKVIEEPTDAEGRNRWLRVTLHEGKNREIRRVFDYLGYPVNRLIRLSYGPFTLNKLPQGTLMEIKPKDWKKALEKK